MTTDSPSAGRLIDFTEIFAQSFKLHQFRTHLITISDGTTFNHLGTTGYSTFRNGSPLLAHFFPRRGLPQQAYGDRILPRPATISHKNPPLFGSLFTFFNSRVLHGNFITHMSERETRHLLRKCTTKQAFTHSASASSRVRSRLSAFSLLRSPFVVRSRLTRPKRHFSPFFLSFLS